MRIGFYTATLYKDDLDPIDIPECTSPISDAKKLWYIMQKWEKLHTTCDSCETPCDIAKKHVDYSDSVLIVKADTVIKTDVLQQIHASILEQKKTGVVILPNGFRATLVPKDLEIQLENGDIEPWV